MVSHLCSNDSSVLCRCPTPRRRARGPYGYCLHPPACRGESLQAPPRSPGSRAWSFQTCMGSTTTQGRPATCISVAGRVAFRSGYGVGALIANFRSSIPSPSFPLFTLHWRPHGIQCKTRGRADRYSFLVRLFHPQLHAGLSRRTPTVSSDEAKRKSKFQSEEEERRPRFLRFFWRNVLPRSGGRLRVRLAVPAAPQ